jgi:quinol monooxygenase YgiN
MSNKISIVVKIMAKTELTTVVREKLFNLASLTNQETGNICYFLNQADACPEQFFIYEQWENQLALDFHMNQEYLKAFLAESEHLLSEEIQGTICSIF